jgi:hypothetical protein
MLNLAKHHAILTPEGESGWVPTGDGIIFHFKDGISVFISNEMEKKISQTFEHQREQAAGIHQAGRVCSDPSQCNSVRCMNAAEKLGLPVKGVDH